MNFKIDKSLFTEAERAAYEALIAKATVEDDEEVEFEIPAGKKKRRPEVEVDVEDEVLDKGCKKSASPEIAKALERLETLEKSIKMNEFTEIAKKYAPLGEKEDELAQTLYDMKKSNEANYNAYVAVLDKSLDLVNKSGIFAEIGKSASGMGGNTVSKIEAVASDIMKSDASMTREQAIAKAWEQHPELIAEYDKEYMK